MNRILVAVPRLSQQCVKKVLVAQCPRNLSTSLTRFDAGPERVDISKIKEKQRHFQIDDGTPVYLKGGFSDYVLFGITVLLCVVGLGYSAKVIYKLSVPPEN